MSTRKPVGASYMPNWDPRPLDWRFWRRDSWAVIRHLFATLMPLKGFYDETEQGVMDQAIREAVWGKLDFWDFDTFYDHGTSQLSGDHALKNFIASKERGLQFAISLDTRNGEVPFVTLDDWKNYCDLLPAFMDDPRYLMHKGRPVHKLISFDHMFHVVAPRIGPQILKPDGTPVVPLDMPDYRADVLKAMLNIANERTGLDIYWCAGVEVSQHWLWQIDLAGFDGHWFYNMSATTFGATRGPAPMSYAELDANYRATWQYLIRLLSRPTDTSGTELWLGLTAGWDSNLPGGRCIGRPTAAEWEAHMAFAKALGDTNDKVVGYVIDAWNEHTEGSVLEPIKAYGRMMLASVRKIFGSTPPAT